MQSQPEASHFIGGRYVEDTQGTPIDVEYPATGEVIARVHGATPAILEHALDTAKEAQGRWAALKPVERGRVLRRAARILTERNRTLSELETLDTAKPLQETLVADAASGAEALEYYGGLAPAVVGETIPLGGDFAYTIREPLGVCAGIGAWNYPTQIACWKAAPALATGNAMVFKPSELTPLCTLKVAEILVEAGLPEGLFNVVQGAGEVGRSLVSDPRVAKVSLTGSVPTGRQVYAAAADGIRAVTMELGGKSPLVIFDDADLEDAVGGALLGNFYSAGQVCTNGTRVFVQRGILERFLDRARARTRAMVVGDPMDEATHIGPLVSARQMDRVMGYIESGTAEGARLVTGGRLAERAGPGHYVEPTIFADVTDDMTIAREEIFGPVMSVLAFDDEDEVVARANASPYGLAAGVFTRDLARAHRMAARLKAGTCWINSYNLTPLEVPFGGAGMSGVGRENGHAAIEYYTQVKAVHVGMGPVDSPY